MFPVSHRHFVMSVPDALWGFLRDWNMKKVYMDSAIKSFNEYFSKIIRQDVKVGVIVILHPFGKGMWFQPHLHLLITEGGYNKNGTFIKCSYVPADGFRKKWQYEVLKALQDNGLSRELAYEMYQKYPKGFYVWLHRRGRIAHPKLIAKYIGRYLRHPAIANSRIEYFDGKDVRFFYTNNEDTKVTVTMTADEFITALIQHIPPPQFKMIRYYGAYARNTKRKYGAPCNSGIKQLSLYKFGLERINKCPHCRNEIVFIAYIGKPPPKLLKEQRELTDYINENIIGGGGIPQRS